MAFSTLIGLLLFLLGCAAAILLLIFVLVPLLRGLGFLIVGLFKGVGWIITHLFEFVAGMISDTLRFVGAFIAMIVFMPLVLLSVVIGRWSAAGHYAESVKREVRVGALCLYRVALQRPLKLVMLHGLLEGVEQRVPEAMAAAPTSDRPNRRIGQFTGYAITGSLRGGGSGAKLYVAEPDADVRRRYPGMPDRVVIKTFAISEGSGLPQIVRESRALECAKQLGLVFEHGMDEQRFYYVMPYHDGDHLGVVTRQLHAESTGDGLGGRQLQTALTFGCDLLRTLTTYHAGGLWHKDVKPENIIVHDGRAHLVDLGLVTPLRSAMTLTTHGTEYFRDPEMVRQALRGVKVHQINGAKFDVYAAGAVLYFLIENTFPPHGALSRFVKRTPDALKWIVRRSMADYNHRYESSDVMLADLHVIATASDPFAVKPAALPSMAGGETFEVEQEDEPVFAAAPPRRTPVPPPLPRQEAFAGPAPTPEHEHVAMPAGPRRAPDLEVTNWWTGAYRVADSGSAGVAMPGIASEPAPSSQRTERRADRAHAADHRRQMAELRKRVKDGSISARKAAKEQVRNARSRSVDIRRRSRARRPGSVAERQPTFTVGAITLVALALIAGIFIYASSRRLDYGNHMVRIGGSENSVAAVPVPPVPGHPSLLVVSNLGDLDVHHEQDMLALLEEYREKGFDVVRDDRIATPDLQGLLAEWRHGDDPGIDRMLEDTLELNDLYGLLEVDLDRSGRMTGSLVWSERKDAEDRRFASFPVPAGDRPYLLVNDHPTKHDPAVEQEIGRRVDLFRARGWEIIVADDLEAEVRSALPTGTVATDAPVPDLLHTILHRADLGGIVYVNATPGQGKAHERIELNVIHGEPVEHADGEASALRLMPRAA